MSDAREITLSQQLWETLDLMAQEMGVPRDGLVSQAVFTLARLNGYLVPGTVALQPSAPRAQTNMSVPQPSRKKTRAAPEPDSPELEDDLSNPFEPSPDDEPAEDQDYPDEQAAPDEEPLDEENLDEEAHEEEPQDEEPAEAEPPSSSKRAGALTLTVTMAGREPFKLTNDSMLVGRGKHCDFVIESNRVSREHARISREGRDFVLEDLSSSNGTFFGAAKEKVTRPRKIKDADEFTFGTEKVKFRIAR